jgi:hypothetical protein
MTRLHLPALAAALLLASAAASAEPQPLTSAAAVWVAGGKVQLDLAWQGGACEEPAEPQVTAVSKTTNQVTIPTVSTAEVCTMQIVEVVYSGIIPAEPLATTLAITVLTPDGRPQATGSTEIAAAD